MRLGRIVRATDFRTEARDPIALTKTATRAIATTDTDATVAVAGGLTLMLTVAGALSSPEVFVALNWKESGPE